MTIIKSQRAVLLVSALSIFAILGNASAADSRNHSPQPIIKVMPDYPRVAWVDRIEGNVHVRFNVNSSGIVENIQIVRASHPVFETNVMDAVSRYRFSPARQNGMAVARTGVTETFRFTLEGDEYDPDPIVTASDS